MGLEIYHAENSINTAIANNKKKIDTLYKCAEEAALAFLHAQQKTPDLQIFEMNILVTFVQDYLQSAKEAQTRIESLEKATDKLDEIQARLDACGKALDAIKE